MKYSDIKSIRELDMAREKLAVEIDSKEKEISRNLANLKEAYSPAALTGTALRSASGIIPFDRIVLSLVRKAISILE